MARAIDRSRIVFGHARRHDASPLSSTKPKDAAHASQRAGGDASALRLHPGAPYPNNAASHHRGIYPEEAFVVASSVRAGVDARSAVHRIPLFEIRR